MPQFDVQHFLKLIPSRSGSIRSSPCPPFTGWPSISRTFRRDRHVGRALAVLRRRTDGARPDPADPGGLPDTPASAMASASPRPRSVATFLPHEYSRLRPETVGFAAPVVDLSSTTAGHEPGVGELLIRGPNS